MSEDNVKREVRPQAEMHFNEHGVKQLHYDAIALAGVTPDDVLERGYWAHVAGRSLKPMTKISIWAEDYSWYGELVAFHIFTNGAHVRWITPPVFLGKVDSVREEQEFEVFNGGAIKKWCVKRNTDGRILIQDCETSEEAHIKLRNWIKSQASPRRAA